MSQRTKRNRRGSTNQSNHNYLSDQSSKHKTSSIKRSHKREVSVHDCCDGCKCELDQETIDFYKQYMMDNVYSTSPYRLRNFHLAIDLVLFAIGAVYVVLAPFTKVEESFNMQATHDMLFHGYTNLEAYDHMQFPGVVPRSFIGSLLLSLMVYPWKIMTIFILPIFLPISGAIHLQQQCQYLIRFAMLFLNIAALSKFRQSFVFAHFVQRADIYRTSNGIKGNVTHHSHGDSNHLRHLRISMIQRFSVMFTVLMAAQFHFLFYCSRLLPNCFALPLVTIAFAEYFRNNFCRAVVCLAASTIWFRCDTAVIALPFIVVMVVTGYQRYSSQFCPFFKLFILYGVAASIGCIALTLLVDSWFWNGFGALKWPELEVLLFNTVDNRSSEWGTSPWRYYFWPLIPKMLLINVVFMCFSIFKIYPMILVHEFMNRYISPPHSDVHESEKEKTQNRTQSDGQRPSLWKLLCSILDWDSIRLHLICWHFVLLYSFLPHKESRFIFFIIPPCTLLSTIGCIRLLTLWGYRGTFAHTQCTMSWFKQNLFERQRQLYYVWIPNELLLSTLVKKLVSLESPSTFAALRKYMRIVLREIPGEIVHKIAANFKAMATNIREEACWQCLVHFVMPFGIVLSIITSVVISWYGVYEASYNYPGGVAITMFPDIVRDFKSNITRYQNGYFAQMNGQYYYNDGEEIPLHHGQGHQHSHHNHHNHHHHQKPNKTRHDAHDNNVHGNHFGNRRATGSKTKTFPKSKTKTKPKGKSRKTRPNEMDKLDIRQSQLFELYDSINCVHIGNLAAISGVTRFMTPSFDREFRFSKQEELSLDDLSAMDDPCDLYQEMYSKLCPNSEFVRDDFRNVPVADKWDDDIYDEEYFERHDDYLGESDNESEREQSPQEVEQLQCRMQIDERYPMIRGFDYLISEHSDIPGFHLLPQGTIYAKSDSISTIKNMFNDFVSFFIGRPDCDAFLEPKLYVLKRTTEFDEI